MNQPIKPGIIGGAGYTAGELIRLLLAHPHAQLAFVQSSSQAGKPLHHIHTDLLGHTDLTFVAQHQPADVLFLCTGHGRAVQFIADNPGALATPIIDLSHDFRLASAGKPKGFIYGLPEANRAAIQHKAGSVHIANPGCFATAIQLALLPLAAEGQLTDEVHIHAITGSTGAGQAPSPTTHFSYRNNNISAYKVFEHQHLHEITETLQQLQPGFSHALNFIPVRGNFTRGIFATAYLNTTLTQQQSTDLYQQYYKGHPFTHVAGRPVGLKEVVNTNRCHLHVANHGNKLVITSIIDNLLKGASGQAVQNMNLLFSLPEMAGLQLKSVVF